MNNGCEKCAKLPRNKLCDTCELDMLEANYLSAFKQYNDKLRDIALKKGIPEAYKLTAAKVGLNALIDEATGYQKDRKPDALRKMAKEYQKEKEKNGRIR